jgi:hypothetical protein
MSDSLPENPLSGVLKVVKLASGEEIIGLVSEPHQDRILIKLPARLENYVTKDESQNIVEYVKLTNYLANIKNFEVVLNRNMIIYIGSPQIELEKMYEAYFITMQADPKSIMTSSASDTMYQSGNMDNGLELLNNLFNNEDFVNFVNDLIDSFEGVEIVEIEEENEEIVSEESQVESDMSDPVQEEPKARPKPKKRSKVKPETNKMPYKPEEPPEDPQSWSDNPQDYI